MGLYTRYMFPWILEWTLSNPEVQEERKRALAGVQGRVLEIGFGTGLNLPHYPPEVTKLAALDPEAPLAGRVAKRIAESGIQVERFQMDAAQRLPVAEHCFDSVVSTFTMCTIPDLEGALSEAHRVLKPGGRFFFLEHGRSEDPGTAKWQDRLNPLQRIIGAGCNINRPIDVYITAAGFEIRTLDRFQMAGTSPILGSMYRGIALRSDT
jgi:SAM-dependent methyltransferase